MLNKGDLDAPCRLSREGLDRPLLLFSLRKLKPKLRWFLLPTGWKQPWAWFLRTDASPSQDRTFLLVTLLQIAVPRLRGSRGRSGGPARCCGVLSAFESGHVALSLNTRTKPKPQASQFLSKSLEGLPNVLPDVRVRLHAARLKPFGPLLSCVHSRSCHFSDLVTASDVSCVWWRKPVRDGAAGAGAALARACSVGGALGPLWSVQRPRPPVATKHLKRG